MKIFYIHGFGSSPNSATKLSLEKQFGQEVIGLTYDYTTPSAAILSLLNQIQSNVVGDEKVLVIGSSLGGWFANQVSNCVADMSFIYYNPAVYPEKTLAKLDVEQSVLEQYKEINEYSTIVRGNERLVFLAVDDELIDYNEAYDKFKPYTDICLTKGGHRMTDNAAKLIKDYGLIMHNKIFV